MGEPALLGCVRGLEGDALVVVDRGPERLEGLRRGAIQLGIAGATIPGLAIKGEIGQQLGYMNAMGVGMLNFVILIVIGIAFSRPESSKRVIGRILRIKPEPEEQYRA